MDGVYLAGVFRDSGKNMIIGCAVSSVLSLAFFVLVFWRKKIKLEIKCLALDIVRLLILNLTNNEVNVIQLGH
jgi:hypothetical protein